MESLEEESSSTFAMPDREDSSSAQVSSLLRTVYQQFLERISLKVSEIVGDPLTIEEEDTLGKILMQFTSLSLEDLSSLTKTSVLTKLSDNSLASRAREAIVTLLADEQMGSILAYWIESVGVRAQHVKWLRSAKGSRDLLKRRVVALSEIARLTPSLEALRTEERELSATIRQLKVEIGEVEKAQKGIQVSLEEITVQNA